MEITAFQGEIALRLLLAAFAGAALGIERELREQAAGLRTHLLVSLGASLFAVVSAFGFDAIVADEPPGSARHAEVTRVASNIVTGVGFLGAGAIIRHGLSIRGLTTAASLWVTAALGTAIGLGLYWAASIAAVIALLSLWALRGVRGRIRKAAGLDREGLRLRVASEGALDEALDELQQHGYRMRHLQMDEREGLIEAQVEVERIRPGHELDFVIGQLARMTGVVEVDWSGR